MVIQAEPWMWIQLIVVLMLKKKKMTGKMMVAFFFGLYRVLCINSLMSFECIIISSLPYHSVEVQKSNSSSSTNVHNPAYIQALADSTDLSLLITCDKHWKAAALRCSSHPQEACESMKNIRCIFGCYTCIRMTLPSSVWRKRFLVEPAITACY